MLTSTIVSYPERGEYGNNKYRGNCSGKLLTDLFEFFKPKRVFDPMAGGMTTAQACEQMNIEHLCLDLNPALGGFDALNDEIPMSYDFGFWHPPYHDIIRYSGEMWGKDPDPRDLSRCKTYEEFIRKIDTVHAKLLTGLRKGGTLAILVGDIKKNGVLYSMQRDMSWFGKPMNVIIKAQHNVESSKTNYHGRFIPIMHEYLLLFRKDDCYVIPAKITKSVNVDIRKSTKITWKDLILATMEDLGGRASLQQLYSKIQHHTKAQGNQFWKEKIRQVVQEYKTFKRVSEGVYVIA